MSYQLASIEFIKNLTLNSRLFSINPTHHNNNVTFWEYTPDHNGVLALQHGVLNLSEVL